ncbi:MAG: hypothetical protein LBL74_02270 [Bacteroidales bacterium]|nr:hypothetical protein [Bacteroidales bacterium]
MKLILFLITIAGFSILSAHNSMDTIHIATPADLVALSDSVATGNNYLNDTIYLDNDIDMASVPNFTPIGSTNSFKGCFDGQGHTINNLTITSNNEKLGLFGDVRTTDTTKFIRNLTIDNADIISTNVNALGVGGLIGYIYGAIKIDNCHITNSNIKSINNTGGLIGNLNVSANNKYIIILNSFVRGCNIKGTIVGGLIGVSNKLYSINNSYVSSTKMTGMYSSNSSVGGMIGAISTINPIEIDNCYVAVSIDSAIYAGAICGNPYNLALVLNVANTYYNADWQGSFINHTTQTTAVSKTKEEMKDSSFVASLNTATPNLFKQDIWLNNGFPIFGNEIFPNPFVVRNGTTMTIPADYNAAIPDNIYIEYGGSFINNSNKSYIATLERPFYNINFTFVGVPFASCDSVRAGDYFGIVDTTYNNVEANENFDGITLLRFNYDNNDWINANNEYTLLGYNSKLSLGNGYIAYTSDKRSNSNDDSLIAAIEKEIIVQHYQDTLFNGDFNLSFSNNGTADVLYYALANPYPANLFANKFINANSQNIDLYSLLPNSTWATLPPDTIKAGDGFLVGIPNSSQPQSFSFNTDMLLPTSNSNKIAANSDLISIDVTNGRGLTKDIYLAYNQEASNGFDGYDRTKLFGFNSEICEPYFAFDDHYLAVSSFSNLPYECPINIMSRSNGEESIQITFSNVIDSGNIATYLIDGQQELEIADGFAYNTTISSGNNANRFRIRIGEKSSLADIINENPVNMWFADNAININGNNLTYINVYNTLGQKVFGKRIGGNEYKADLNLVCGMYSAKATSINGSKTIKFFVSR